MNPGNDRQARIRAFSKTFFLAAGLAAGAGLLQPVPVGAATPVLEIGTPVILSGPDHKAMAPDVAVAADGSLHVLWIRKGEAPPANPAEGHNHNASDELWYRRSGAGGQDFRAPVRVNSRDGEVWGFAVSKPELDVDAAGIVHVFFSANDTQPGGSKAILAARYTRSTDDGRSFEPGRTLNSPAGNDLSAVMHGGFASAHAFGTLLAAGDGVHAYWIDTRFMGEKDPAGALFAAFSGDGGRSFTPDEPVYRNDVCPCCQLAAAATGPGNREVLLGTRTTFEGGFRDSTVSHSTSGDRFGDRVPVGGARWAIEGCPLKRTAIAAAGDQVYTAAFNGAAEPAGVWFARSGDRGRRFDQPVLIHPGAAISDAPTVAATADGRVYVAWHGKTDGPRRVFLRASADGGRTFGDVMELPSAPGTAAYPELDIAPDGSAWLVWQQEQAAAIVRLNLPAPAATAEVGP